MMVFFCATFSGNPAFSMEKSLQYAQEKDSLGPWRDCLLSAFKKNKQRNAKDGVPFSNPTFYKNMEEAFIEDGGFFIWIQKSR